ncbi:glycosyltransferase [Qipengyuania sp. NPDC077410]|uniref:glycosyltransferase n=1 Tax=Qipengyuania sp. NPDC077410 TaxID=3364496 RepID=UPI0037C80E68
MIKVAVSYRVMQSWRVPVFSRLSKCDGIDLCVFHGEDFEGSKVVNFSGPLDFKTKEFRSLKFSFSTLNGPAHLPFHFGLWSALKAFDPDVIITEGASNALNNLICFAFARRNGRKIVQWGLGKLRGRKPSIARRALDAAFFRKIESNSDAAIAYSSLGAKYYSEAGISPHRIYTAVNTVDTVGRQAKAKICALGSGMPWPSEPPEEFNILFVGALTYNKNVELLLKVFARLVEEIDDAFLTIVGDGILRADLEAIASELGIDKKVCFTGHLGDEITPYFLNATVMVLPGLGGLAVSDALCHGVPVICGIGDGSEADLVTTENGEILDPLTENTLFDALKRLHRSPVKQRTWRANSIKVIEEKYNIESYVFELERCVREVVKC